MGEQNLQVEQSVPSGKDIFESFDLMTYYLIKKTVTQSTEIMS